MMGKMEDPEGKKINCKQQITDATYLSHENIYPLGFPLNKNLNQPGCLNNVGSDTDNIFQHFIKRFKMNRQTCKVIHDITECIYQMPHFFIFLQTGPFYFTCSIPVIAGTGDIGFSFIVNLKTEKEHVMWPIFTLVLLTQDMSCLANNADPVISGNR